MCSERHVNAEHTGQNSQYSKCHKSFNRLDNKNRHEKTCSGTDHVCPTCNKRCSTAHGLRRHLQCHYKEPTKQSTVACPTQSLNSKTSCYNSISSSEPSTHSSFRCRRCTRSFENRRDLYLHGMQVLCNHAPGTMQMHLGSEKVKTNSYGRYMRLMPVDFRAS